MDEHNGDRCGGCGRRTRDVLNVQESWFCVGCGVFPTTATGRIGRVHTRRHTCTRSYYSRHCAQHCPNERHSYIVTVCGAPPTPAGNSRNAPEHHRRKRAAECTDEGCEVREIVALSPFHDALAAVAPLKRGCETSSSHAERIIVVFTTPEKWESSSSGRCFRIVRGAHTNQYTTHHLAETPRTERKIASRI